MRNLKDVREKYAVDLPDTADMTLEEVWNWRIFTFISNGQTMQMRGVLLHDGKALVQSTVFDTNEILKIEPDHLFADRKFVTVSPEGMRL